MPSLTPPTANGAVQSSSDEVTSIVIECGSSYTRVGFSGDDLPKVVIPTKYGKYTNDKGEDVYEFGLENVHRPVAGKEIYSPVQDGCIQDWDGVAKLWEYAIKEKLKVDDLSEYPLVITEQMWNSSARRAKIAEMCFDKFRSPAISFVKNPLCTAYAAVRPNSIIVEIGSAVASVSTVLDGNVVTKASFHSKFGGDFLNYLILEEFKRKQVEVIPSYLVKKKKDINDPNPSTFLRELPGMTDSYKNFEIERVLDNFKETTLQVNYHPIMPHTPLPPNIQRPYEFPDGSTYIAEQERFGIAESLFRPVEFGPPGVVPEGTLGISELIYHAVLKTDPKAEVQMELLNNIVVVGGTTLLNGLTARIHRDMAQFFTQFHVKQPYLSVTSTERKSLAWTGASVFASLGNFGSSWVIKQEYEEQGADVIDKRFK
ncbi:actin family [Yarrowia lipolytica]|jgi:actin-related protein 4|uniref:YALI0F26345p n=2 Tax=Yarrowia lipolytica TaxID=4952 RepID=Q6C0A9_YARLI|nr:YALI0F26345p [Yarrowia lipolytica CLIB122]AOW07735.1 hypothetical protein YALI1_F33764g [Yarrowia lipolytica]KAB8284536.1 actin family [Yarrowia lipolytica]KAE8174423.1 actin family [Yarrowia lipolytica]KAJ8055213.1 actin family [Yarrowia lipolytica]QNP99435.1 Actin-related protein 4 [Yarrowia lipolytica]|eukprot:XP_505903.1 YALI0F26345p [Yarrowia lipolytica CLIB122]